MWEKGVTWWEEGVAMNVGGGGNMVNNVVGLYIRTGTSRSC